MTVEGGRQASWIWGRHSALGFRLALATLVADQASKIWVLDVLDLPNRGRIYVAPFMDLAFSLNTGISYSLLDQASFNWQVMLAVFALAASIGLWIWMAHSASSRLVAISLGLIIGGAIGNGIDRLRLGGVADFVSLHAHGFYWYIFNIADVAIVAGVVGLLYDSFVASRNDAAKPL